MDAITLKRAKLSDAQQIHEMKYRVFWPLYEKYRDDATSPVMEKIEKVQKQLQSGNTDYFLIEAEGEAVGAIRIVRDGMIDGMEACRISPLFVLPEYQGRGIGYAAIQKAFAMYPQAQLWRLATIKEEKGNCHLYEKCGFVRTGERQENERMTLVFYERKAPGIG